MANLASTTIDGTITEKRGTSSISGTTITVDMSTGNYFEVSLATASGNIVTFNVTNVPSAGQVGTFIIKILQSSTPRTIDWSTIAGTIASGNIKWKVTPTISTARDDIDVYSFTTYDSGATWFGSVIGQEFKSVSIYGNRGVFCGGDYASSGQKYGYIASEMDSDKMDYITIDTNGNATTFGNLGIARGYLSACSDGQRGVIGGGRVYNDPGTPVESNVIDYITIATLGASTDFGNLTVARQGLTSTSSPTRGIFAGGYINSPPTYYNTIDYITIITPADAADFGDMIGSSGNDTLTQRASCSDGSRGVLAAGYDGTSVRNYIEYISFDHPSNGTDFGTLTSSFRAAAGTSDGSRGVIAGGTGPPSRNAIDYITIATPGNAGNFGNLTRSHYYISATSNGSRGVFGGGWTDPVSYPPSNSQQWASKTIDYIDIVSTGNALDFGDLTSTRDTLAACSGN